MLLIKREIMIAKLYVKLILGWTDGGRAIKKLNIKAKQTNAKLKIIIILSIAGMSIGLILKNKPLQPSCGGIYLEKGDTCKVCGKTVD